MSLKTLTVTITEEMWYVDYDAITITKITATQTVLKDSKHPGIFWNIPEKGLVPQGIVVFRDWRSAYGELSSVVTNKLKQAEQNFVKLAELTEN
jgi:hypothetical protein